MFQPKRFVNRDGDSTTNRQTRAGLSFLGMATKAASVFSLSCSNIIVHLQYHSTELLYADTYLSQPRVVLPVAALEKNAGRDGSVPKMPKPQSSLRNYCWYTRTLAHGLASSSSLLTATGPSSRPVANTPLLILLVVVVLKFRLPRLHQLLIGKQERYLHHEQFALLW